MQWTIGNFSTQSTEYVRSEGGRYVYRIQRSPMCEYMINFIHKLKHLPEKYMMNSVLENFTILQASRGQSLRAARESLGLSAAARPVTPSKPSTASPTTKPATTIAPSPSTGPPAATSAATLEPPTTPPSRRNETGSKRPEKPSTLTILSISTGLLLLFLCLACVMATVWRRTGSRGELEGKGDSSKSFAEATEIQYAEVTVNTRSQPLSDFVTYGNLYFHTIAEDRSQEGSVEYAAVKR
ncbi:uncharacterized protein LOC118211677 isoform X5 [Anguilla anguilla]|uniref:uncharacterized protein LOC118211677 isoform X5 n=1 Tax=Anguilla anguilla TaxID=7936 RepID=UPI0015B18622|nr:uncharacterized protein LOC118211677 isoform X5 [Anguilla anguilla]